MLCQETVGNTIEYYLKLYKKITLNASFHRINTQYTSSKEVSQCWTRHCCRYADTPVDSMRYTDTPVDSMRYTDTPVDSMRYTESPQSRRRGHTVKSWSHAHSPPTRCQEPHWQRQRPPTPRAHGKFIEKVIAGRMRELMNIWKNNWPPKIAFKFNFAFGVTYPKKRRECLWQNSRNVVRSCEINCLCSFP